MLLNSRLSWRLHSDKIALLISLVCM
jgi:hypothetical protein